MLYRSPFGFWYNGGGEPSQARAGRLVRAPNTEETSLNNHLENIIEQWVKVIFAFCKRFDLIIPRKDQV